MIVHEGIREFQKQVTRYLNGNEVVIIEDGKTHQQKGVYIPFALYQLFQEQLHEAVRQDIAASFSESFDESVLVHER